MPWQGRGGTLDSMLRSMVTASPDFEGAVVVGLDGLIMAAAWSSSGQNDFDVGAIAARAFELSEQASEGVGRGDLQRLIMTGSAGNMVIVRAGPHALCVALLNAEAKVGLASYEAWRVGRAIAEVLQ